MNGNLEVLTGHKEAMTSLEIAEVTGKQHAHVMRDIRVLIDKINESTSGLVDCREDYHRGDRTQYKYLSDKTQAAILDWCLGKQNTSSYIIESSTYKDTKGEERNMYILNKKACLLLASGYDVILRAKIINRWEELEIKERTGGFVVPQTFSQALMLAARQQEEIERQQKTIEAKDRKITEDAPKVVFSDAVVGSKSSCLIGELAKILTQNGYQIGQNRLFEKLRNEGYLGSKGEYYNIPNQKFIEQGLFELKKTTHSENGVMKSSVTPKVTGKGQQYFINKYLKGITTIRFDEEDD